MRIGAGEVGAREVGKEARTAGLRRITIYCDGARTGTACLRVAATISTGNIEAGIGPAEASLIARAGLVGGRLIVVKYRDHSVVMAFDRRTGGIDSPIETLTIDAAANRRCLIECNAAKVISGFVGRLVGDRASKCRDARVRELLPRRA